MSGVVEAVYIYDELKSVLLLFFPHERNISSANVQ
jgi:hypothetical protein